MNFLSTKKFTSIFKLPFKCKTKIGRVF